MTAGPASVLGIRRGVLEEGAAADLCIFKLDELRVDATFEDPERMCAGFRYVLVGGRVVVDHDRWMPEAAGAGEILKRS